MKKQQVKMNKAAVPCLMTPELTKQTINNIKVSFGKPRKDGNVTVKINGLPKPLFRCFQKIAKADCMSLFFKR